MKSFNQKAKELEQEGNRLRARREFLGKELARLQDASKQFDEEALKYENLRKSLAADIKDYPKGTWVINNSNVYYQFVSKNGYEITLFRKGIEKKISFFDFIKEFRIANNVEVAQHEAFLRSQVIYPVVNSYKVEHKKTYIDPEDCEFYMVTCTGIHGSKVRHTSYGQAMKEAKRIAKKMNHPAWVVGVVAKVNP